MHSSFQQKSGASLFCGIIRIIWQANGCVPQKRDIIAHKVQKANV
jgi:hypothetical protein